jgi:tetratricopeptide (TPR) repeat protein
MTRTTRLSIALLAGAIALAALTYPGRDRGSRPAPERLPTLAVGTLPGGTIGTGFAPPPGQPRLAELERLIRAFGDQTSDTPNASGLAFLGQLELERARLTGDVTSYVRAEEALHRAVELAPTNTDARSLLAGVRFTTHDFVGAYDLASQIYERSGDLAALAVRGDAALELGRYDRAAADYDLLAAAVPDASSTLVRLARLTFLRGDAVGAERLAAAAERAAASEGAFGATRAWYATFRGRIALDGGNLDDAEKHLRRALRAAPGYHTAIAGMAAVRTAQGRLEAAIRLYERAIAAVPDPAALAALGDVYAATEDEESASDRYATVEAIATLAGTGTRLYDRQLALFRADHGGDLDETLRIARDSLRTRRDVYGYDALGWVLYRLGRHDEAREVAHEALALGTPDPRLWFHAGMISAALGDEPRAREELGRALELSPRFDVLLAPVARRTLASLGGGAP